MSRAVLVAARPGPLAASLAALILALAACTSQRARKWDERGEDFLHSGVDLHLPPVTEAGLAEMASPTFDWKGYWRPRPSELPTKYAKAAHAFSRAVQIQPGVARFHANLGLSLLGLREPGRAEECFRRALALDPGNAEARQGLAAAEAALRARPDEKTARAAPRR
jgi:tetratricopeptide (TPR) repeat protein